MGSDQTGPRTNFNGVEPAEARVVETPGDKAPSGPALPDGESADPDESALPPTSPVRLSSETPSQSDSQEEGTLRLRHANSTGSPPLVLDERLGHWLALAVGIPLAVGFTYLAVWSYREGERLISLGFIASALLGCACVLWWLGMRLVAGRDGIVLTHEFRTHRIPWSDLDYFEFEVVPTTPEKIGSTTLVLVTREMVRIPVTDLNGSTDAGGYLYTLAQRLLAMRDAYAPELGDPATAPIESSVEVSHREETADPA